MGTSTHAATGCSPRLAGTKRQRRTVSRAALSSRGCPLESRICTSSAPPDALTSTRRSTRPCSPARRERGGYAGGGLFRYAALNTGAVTGTSGGGAGGAEATIGSGSGAGGGGAGATLGAGASTGAVITGFGSGGFGRGLAIGLGFGLDGTISTGGSTFGGVTILTMIGAAAKSAARAGS